MPDQLGHISIAPETIGELLKQGSLRVPRHQRPYAWGEEQIKDLYKDLAQAIESGASEYFLGSIVVVNPEPDIYEINDGQQRLATSLIFIAAIRDYLLEMHDGEGALIVEAEYLSSTDLRTRERKPKLALNIDDNIFFEELILRRPDSKERMAATPSKPSHQRIMAAAKIAKEYVLNLVARFHEEHKINELSKWLEFLKLSARIIVVTVPDERTAYIVFETMNDRGLQLSAADLLKNNLLSRAGSAMDEVFNKWAAMTATVESIDDREDAVVDFIRYAWIAKNGQTRTKDLYDAVKQYVRDRNSSLSMASRFAERALDYAALLNPAHERWAKYDEETRSLIAVLNFLQVKQLRPLLLAAIEKFQPAELRLLFRGCVSWSVRFVVSGGTPGNLEGYYAEAAKKVTEMEFKTALQIATHMSQIIPNDMTFMTAMSQANVPKARLARYYLRALQQQIDSGNGSLYVPADTPIVTLEHVLPKNPEGKWPTFSPVDAQAYVNRLGNQALLSNVINTNIGNESFAEKRPVLQESEFSLTREIGDVENWDAASIETRQRRLAEQALVTWPMFP